MSYVEIETGRYVKRWAFWDPATWSIPKLYWDAWSQEQRLHAICRQLEKVIKYADYLGVNVDDIAARLKAIEDGQLDPMIQAAIEAWFEENQPEIVQAIEDLQTAVGDETDARIDADDQIRTDLGQDINGLDGRIDAIEADSWVTENRISDGSVSYGKLGADVKADIEAIPFGLWGASETAYQSGKWAILYSPRPDTVYKIATPDLNFQDACSCYEIDGRFYVFCNNSYFLSENLENWTQYSYNNVNPNGNYDIYPPTFMRCPLGDFVFWEYYNSLNNCEIWYSTCTVDENGILSYGQKVKLTQFANDNYIDYTCIYKEGVGYIAAVKDETASTVSVYTGSDFRQTMSNVSSNSVVTGVEAPVLVDAGESVYMVMNAYSFLAKTLGNVIYHNTEAFNVIAEVWTSVVGFRTTYFVNPMKSDVRAYRHIGLAKCTLNSFQHVKRLQSIENETRIGFPSNQITLTFNVSASLGASDVVAIPNFDNMKVVLSGASKGILVPVNTSGKVVSVPILSNTGDTISTKARIGYSPFDQTLPATGYGRTVNIVIDDAGHMYLDR